MTGALAAAPRRAEADRTPEDRGIARDGVRLLVSRGDRDEPRRFLDLADALAPGDLLVVNESATLPASLPAVAPGRSFWVNLSTQYDPRLWLVETRWAHDRPGPVPLALGETFRVAGVRARLVAEFPGSPRLAFLRSDADLRAAMVAQGRPIRYGYLAREYPLADYQTIFARVPGSAEMPSAARPFTPRVLARLAARGVGVAPLVLHTGVSSLEGDPVTGRSAAVFPEPFDVPSATIESVRATRARGGRVIAVGTTVVRALESAVDGCGLRAARGFTSLYLRAGRPLRAVDGLLSGFHGDRTTHLDLLETVVPPERLARAYARARSSGFLWHEFGDSHLMLPN
ncbi:MAG TPA: S-adenosylmethionine:tRNA ribosyltransferase-isomerase [Thermoplasmata archaeon]|nr:S-adenosylmethionine:tRNA ribosyltransferase-isomerase [Thermoplasmata archaeon]HTW77403.1 S-adenosylmethionine:tRNA ribosyltransferase-isomerase [Thermoplasmata archaeon]